ncbi:MAG: MBL fold metallo-hydrolase [Gemmatimonadota bacterium]|nr:MBL fold metallo-hydrolase [Gemmatimonadota bacterium]
MKLTFWGAARTVTGSMHLLELDNGRRVLLDCGLYQGRRADAWRINSELPFAASSIDAVILSHAHIDHSGLLPRLVREGFQGRIWATHATYDLCAVMLLDSAHIQEKDAEYLRRRRNARRVDVQVLYTAVDAERALDLFVGVGYRQTFEPVPGMKVEFRDAGHILGSATVQIEVTERGRTTRVGFTGDVGRPDRPILRDPQTMADCDWLICESTYGGKVHEPRDRAKARLQAVVAETSRRGGRVLIPAFAVGRTQEIVHALDQLAAEDRLPRIPVFVDSPLAISVTSVYQLHPECFDREMHEYLRTDADPFGFEQLTYIRDAEDSKKLNHSRIPMVIISASGMCEAGRILHHLKNGIEDPRNTVMIVGFCAEHTLGRRIVERQPTVRIFGEPYELKAQVEVMNSYSAHADEPELVDFLAPLDRERLREVFLVHGDLPRQEALRDRLRSEGYRSVRIPERGESVEL